MIRPSQIPGCCLVDFDLDTRKVVDELRQAKEMGYEIADLVLSDGDKAKLKDAWEVYWETVKERTPANLFGVREVLKKDQNILLEEYFSENGDERGVCLDEVDEHELLDMYSTAFTIPVAILTNYDKIMAYKKGAN